MKAQTINKEVICNAVNRAIFQNVADTIIDMDTHWNHAFGVYAIVFSALHGAAESMMVEMLSVIKPSLNDWQRAEEWAGMQRKPSNCKMRNSQWKTKKTSECIRSGWIEGDKVLVQPYPWYRGEVAHAIETLDPQFFERWAQRECKENHNIINNLVDTNTEYLDFDVKQIRYTIQNNMNRQFIDDAKVKTLVYTCRLLYRIIENFHLYSMWVGPVMPDDKNAEEVKAMNITGPGQSPSYSKAWEKRMATAIPVQNIKAMDVLYRHFCQGWEHDDKSIDYGVTAIIRKAADENRLYNFDMEPVLTDSGFERELCLVNSLDCYSEGMFPVNIALLQCVKKHIDGLSLDEVDKLNVMDTRGLTRQQRVRYLATAAICKGINEDIYSTDTFNDYMRQCMSIKPMPVFGSQLEKITFETAMFVSCYSALLSAPGTVNPNTLPPAIAKFLGKDKRIEEKKSFKEGLINAFREELDVAHDMLEELEAAKQRVEAQRQQRVEAAPSSEPTPLPPHTPLHTPLALEIDPGSPRKHSNHWTVEEREYLMNHYKDSMESIQQHIGRTAHAIRNKIYRMGLSKTK